MLYKLHRAAILICFCVNSLTFCFLKDSENVRAVPISSFFALFRTIIVVFFCQPILGTHIIHYQLSIMKIDYIIVGQGLCGTFLSWYLEQYNKSYIIIDEDKPFTASKVSSGIVNPITGRRFVKTWMIDELLSFIDKVYTAIQQSLNIKCIEQKNVIHFFSNTETQNIFHNRLQEDSQYLKEHTQINQFTNYFNVPLGYGEISPCYLCLLYTSLLMPRNKIK